MQKRNPKKVLILHTLTLGLYLFYWCSKSRKEINTLLGRKAVPSVWWIIVPFGVFWWAWLYGEAIEEATGKQIKRDNTFGLMLIATLAAPSPIYILLNMLSYRVPDSNGEQLSWTVIIAVGIVLYIISTIVLGIFPSSIQSHINKLKLAPKQDTSPAPATV